MEKLRDEYEAMSKAGTGEEEIEPSVSDNNGCETCKASSRSWKLTLIATVDGSSSRGKAEGRRRHVGGVVQKNILHFNVLTR